MLSGKTEAPDTPRENIMLANRVYGNFQFGRIVFAWFLCIYAVSAGETHPEIEGILKKSPTERIRIYPSVFRNATIPLDARNMLLKAFAQDARNLSPRYGRSSVRIDQREWIGLLSEGLEAFPEDQSIVYALVALLINSQEYNRALQIVAPYHKMHPYHDTMAWMEYCSVHTMSDSPAKELPVFDIHFCVLANSLEAKKKCTLKQLKREVLILNKTFKTLGNKSLVNFRYKSASFYEDIKPFHSELELMTNNSRPFDSNKFNEYFNQCKNPKLRDRQSINFYIYDSYNSKAGYDDITSHGRRNSNRPYILIDWKRLNNNVQNPSAHEMGHAFGLGHVAVPGATIKTGTNIMGSTQYGFGSGGNRRLGFTESQVAIILYHAKRTLQRLSG